MPKREIEFIDVDTHYEWKPVEGDTLGIKEKILSRDPETKSYTRLLKFPPGIRTQELLVHDFWEEVLILEGELIDLDHKNFLSGSTMPITKIPQAMDAIREQIWKDQTRSLENDNNFTAREGGSL